MLRALATTLGALDAAAEMDDDLDDADKQMLASERDTLQPHFDAVLKAQQDLFLHLLLVALRKQARVVIGDASLDRGASAAKARMKVELKGTKAPDGADHVFGANITDLINAPRAEEPQMVLEAVARFGDVPDFAGKQEMAAKLTARADRQKQAFADRDAASVTEATLDSALTKAIEAGSNALYGLEKRLLTRFPRETRYVRAFFLDVAPGKPKKNEP
jgi:hypothetical protein